MPGKSIPHLLSFFVSLALLFGSCTGRDNRESGAKQESDSSALRLEELSGKIAAGESDPGLFNERSKIYLLDHRFDKALNDINRAISLDPSVPDYFITLSDIYLLMGQPEKTREALNKALSLDPRDNNSLLKMARLSLILKEYSATFEYVQKCLDAEPVNPRAYFTRAIAMLESGDTSRAVEDLKRAVDQDQKYFEAFVQLGALYSLKKDNMAAGYFQNALKLKPADKEVLYMLGMFYQETGQYEKALQTYTLLETADTSLRTASYNKGYIYLVYLKDFPTAIEMFSKAIVRDPDYFEAYFNRGYAYELSGDLKNAYGDYQKTLRIRPNYPKAVEGLNRLDKILYRR